MLPDSTLRLSPARIAEIKASALDLLQKGRGYGAADKDCMAVLAVLNQDTALCPRETAAQAARFVFGSFRKSDAADPETFAIGVERVFCAFATGIVMRAADPLEGLASRHRYLPSIEEILSFCKEVQRERDLLRALMERMLKTNAERRNAREQPRISEEEMARRRALVDRVRRQVAEGMSVGVPHEKIG